MEERLFTGERVMICFLRCRITVVARMHNRQKARKQNVSAYFPGISTKTFHFLAQTGDCSSLPICRSLSMIVMTVAAIRFWLNSNTFHIMPNLFQTKPRTPEASLPVVRTTPGKRDPKFRSFAAKRFPLVEERQMTSGPYSRKYTKTLLSVFQRTAPVPTAPPEWHEFLRLR
jgi:hypothetical protein